MKHTVNVMVVNLVYKHPKRLMKMVLVISAHKKKKTFWVSHVSSIFPTQIDPHTFKGNQLDEFNVHQSDGDDWGANYPVSTK